MATQNCKSCKHITIFFLNLMHMRFLTNPNASAVKQLSLNAMKYVGHQTPKHLEILLRGETNFFVRILRYYSVLHLFLIKNIVTKLKSKNCITSFSKNLKYQKNSLQYSYNSTETFDVKTSCKNNAEFIYLFLKLIQTLCNLFTETSSLFDVNVKK